ncbi:MAG: efflux transporter outer membrane subunit [Kiritimatiellales bacterium]|nr:efflux transporter outer membrane subunit [Kiritimatiellales bacterium]
MKTLLYFLPLLLMCSSCAVFSPDRRADLNADLPEQFTLYSTEGAEVMNRWWLTFQSAELNGLIEESLTKSPTIHQAWARLAQAEAVAKKAGASLWPSLISDASGSTRQNMTTRASTESYSLGLTASYELDLWGRVKSGKAAAAMDRDASREQLNTAAITLASQTALSWSGLVSQQLQTDLIRQQLESNKTSLELVELRFRKSQATALDVYQQRQTVANTEARLPLAELREELLRNQLAALLGRNDFQSLEVLDENLPSIGSLPSIGIPADVLANRPDVRRAGLLLRSADWSVSAARADRLPSIRLTASGEYSNARFSDLFDSWYANLIGSVTGPLFEGGRRKAEVERTRAVVTERLAAYRETVLNAMKEVEDALVSEQKQRDYIEALDRNLELSRSSYDEALNRYRNGLSEYLPVLVELVSLQAVERDRIAAQYDLLQYRINLYRALGGSWPADLKTPSFESEDS